MIGLENIPSDINEAPIVDPIAYDLLNIYTNDMGSTLCLGISSLDSQSIRKNIEFCVNTYRPKTMLLSNTDVYRDRDVGTSNGFEKLYEYMGNLEVNFIIQTLGYQDKKIKDNIWQISYPYMFSLKHQDIYTFNDRQYGFSYLNNYPKYFRIKLGHALWKNNLLDNIYYTQSFWERKTFNLEKYLDMPKFKEFLKLLPIQERSEKNKNMTHDHTVNNPGFKNSYAHIYTESEVDDEVCTEKTFKPYVSGQIPIPLTCKGHLRYLKGLGFHVFDDLLGQEYDYLDYSLKIIRIIEIVKKGKSFIEDYYFENLPKIKENNENVKTLHKKRLTSLQNKV